MALVQLIVNVLLDYVLVFIVRLLDKRLVLHQTGIYYGKIWWNNDTKPYWRTELYDDIFLEDGLTTRSFGDDRSTPRHAFRGGLESVTVNSRFPVEGRAHCCVLSIHNAQLSTTKISASIRQTGLGHLLQQMSYICPEMSQTWREQFENLLQKSSETQYLRATLSLTIKHR